MEEAQYKKYYVAFLDILGFKDLINNPETTCQSILNIYREFEVIQRAYYGKEYGDTQDVKMKVMSDSICFFIEEDRPNALYSLMSFCAAFQYGLLIQPQPIFVRGGIALGDMFIEDDIVFGSALTQAYLLEEKNAKVPRIIILKETLEHGKLKADANVANLMEGVTFRDYDAFYTLDYFYLIWAKGNNKKKIEKIQTVISRYLDTTEDESIRQKFLYVDKNMRNAEKYMQKN